MTRSVWLTYDQFAPRVGEPFELAVGDGTALAVELADATTSDQPGGPGPEGQQRDQFSVVFRGPLTPVVPQGTYSLTHAEMGEIVLFLVPLGPDSWGMRYEAAFA